MMSYALMIRPQRIESMNLVLQSQVVGCMMLLDNMFHNP